MTAEQSAAVDPLDLRILAALAERPDASIKELAEALAIPASTCAFRMRSLRSRGVILGMRLEIDPAALGRPLQAVIRVRLGNHSKSRVEALFDALERTAGVLQVFHIAGADDFLVHVAVADAAALRDIVLERITVHDVVRATETQLVFERREGVGALPRG
ncbi:Lrp/AsnC family transcriptional regulator [Microbacterium capsulatum]|uniref:Lrp/AsnC family transcriptional regulator n=1 Tax=Microbacterium capsulatum TaxID=3041921 RepID=A0ABU0XBU7_9MICO|nr:Lrp/AsnC family transcriptional regulator [Microbacterium sp. ASV81]MDQ4212581.1 Lrp/AsnC family transcriptional regulator [Microbacterium sp. ASV81]